MAFFLQFGADAMMFISEKAEAHWQGAGLTHAGLVRSSNQDAFVMNDEIGLWVVADGMGGRAGGDIASAVTVQVLLQHFNHRSELPRIELGQSDVATQLQKAITVADEAIRERAREKPELTGMATTVVAAAVSSLSPLRVAVGHVGDSRAYLYRDQELVLLTRDHSLVEDLLAKGQVSPEEVSTHPQRHILLRALGVEDQTEPDISCQTIRPDDILLLCTDGITNMLSHQQMAIHLNLASHSPDDACHALVSEANLNGGKDNSTVVVVHFL
jgi:serine/threonine protein phosphatase PrpC